MGAKPKARGLPKSRVAVTRVKRETAPKKVARPESEPAPTKITSPVRPTNAAKIYTSPGVDIGFAAPEHRFARADLEIHGIFHGEASYEGRVFLNNPKADAATAKTLENGYAGSFSIFGHGGCVGDVGHCELSGAKASPYDLRNPHPLTPAKKRVRVTEALRHVAKTSGVATVTIVPIVTAANDLCDTTNVFRCEGLRFVSYNA